MDGWPNWKRLKKQCGPSGVSHIGAVRDAPRQRPSETRKPRTPSPGLPRGFFLWKQVKSAFVTTRHLSPLGCKLPTALGDGPRPTILGPYIFALLRRTITTLLVAWKKSLMIGRGYVARRLTCLVIHVSAD